MIMRIFWMSMVLVALVTHGPAQAKSQCDTMAENLPAMDLTTVESGARVIAAWLNSAQAVGLVAEERASRLKEQEERLYGDFEEKRRKTYASVSCGVVSRLKCPAGSGFPCRRTVSVPRNTVFIASSLKPLGHFFSQRPTIVAPQTITYSIKRSGYAWGRFSAEAGYASEFVNQQIASELDEARRLASSIIHAPRAKLPCRRQGRKKGGRTTRPPGSFFATAS